MGNAEKFQYARRHVLEFQDAKSLVDRGGLKPDQRAKPRAVQLTYIAEIDNNAAALRDQRFYHFFNFTGSFADQPAVTFDSGDLIPAFIFLLRLFNFTMEGTI